MVCDIPANFDLRRSNSGSEVIKVDTLLIRKPDLGLSMPFILLLPRLGLGRGNDYVQESLRDAK